MNDAWETSSHWFDVTDTLRDIGTRATASRQGLLAFSSSSPTEFQFRR
jgi:hypothetical protein